MVTASRCARRPGADGRQVTAHLRNCIAVSDGLCTPSPNVTTGPVACWRTCRAPSRSGHCPRRQAVRRAAVPDRCRPLYVRGRRLFEYVTASCHDERRWSERTAEVTTLKDRLRSAWCIRTENGGVSMAAPVGQKPPRTQLRCYRQRSADRSRRGAASPKTRSLIAALTCRNYEL